MVELPSHLTDPDLLAAVGRLAADERATTAALVAHLVEVDRRRLAVAAGYSLFEYCHRVLMMPEDAAGNRTTAVRVARAFPAVLPMLADGRLSLSTIRILAPHLTADNQGELLAEAAGKSKRAVEEVVARRFPMHVCASVRKLPARQARPFEAPEGGHGPAASGADSGLSGADSPSPCARPASAASADTPPAAAAIPRPPLAGRRAVTPMAEDVFLIRLAAKGDMVARLRHAQDLLSHAVPRGDVTEVFDRGLKALIAELEKKKLGAKAGPRRARTLQAGADPLAPAPRTRHIEVAVRRAVWRRDHGRCAYVSPGGRRCEARAFLQLHHLKPYVVGGPATVENIALRCRAHNQYEADVYFAPFRQAMSRRHLSEGDSIRPGADDTVPGGEHDSGTG
jgi:hypothetical protein